MLDLCACLFVLSLTLRHRKRTQEPMSHGPKRAKEQKNWRRGTSAHMVGLNRLQFLEGRECTSRKSGSDRAGWWSF